MSKLKLGDRVWKSGTIVQGQHGLKWASYPELGDQDGHLIPDAPNLAAVARVIAAHGDALTKAVAKALDSAVYWVEIQDKWAAQLVELEGSKPRAAIEGSGK